jgi:hypothetical protein
MIRTKRSYAHIFGEGVKGGIASGAGVFGGRLEFGSRTRHRIRSQTWAGTRQACIYVYKSPGIILSYSYIIFIL